MISSGLLGAKTYFLTKRTGHHMVPIEDAIVLGYSLVISWTALIGFAIISRSSSSNQYLPLVNV